MPAIPSRFFGRLGAVAAACAAALVLSACGGGGGSDSPRVTVPTGVRSATASAGADLSIENFQSVAAPAVRALVGSNPDDLLPLAAGREQAMAARRASAGGLNALQLDTLARGLLARGAVRERPALDVGPQVCSNGGTLTVGAVDADGNGDLGPGDSITINANNCVIEPGLPAVSGGFTMTVNVIEARGDTLVGLDVTATFDHFGAVGYGTANGSFRLWSRASGNDAQVRISYQGTITDEQGANGAGLVISNFDVYSRTVAGVVTAEVSGGIGIGGQTYVIETTTPLQGLQPPSAGVLRLKDAQGDFARIAARTLTSFDLDFFLAGDPLNPAWSLPGQLWDDYEL